MKQTTSAFFSVVLSSKVDKSTVMIETTRFQLKYQNVNSNLNQLDIVRLPYGFDFVNWSYLKTSNPMFIVAQLTFICGKSLSWSRVGKIAYKV